MSTPYLSLWRSQLTLILLSSTDASTVEGEPLQVYLDAVEVDSGAAMVEEEVIANPDI